jgi:hypothetical protein
MQFVEAFDALGYAVQVPRQDWSAEKPDGVCISLWKKELGTRDGMLWMNTRIPRGPIGEMGHESGESKAHHPPPVVLFMSSAERSMS